MVSYDHDVENHDHNHLDYDPHDHENLLDLSSLSLRALYYQQFSICGGDLLSYEHDVENHDDDYYPHDHENLLHLSSLRALLLEPLLSSPDERAPSLRSVLT